jgi:hypothetical protein
MRDDGLLEFESTVIGANDERRFLHGWREGQGWSGKETVS